MITERAYAKINLCLDVTGKRPNGYHDVRMIMQTVDMAALNVDIALGGMEQRKIQMLARENLEKIGENVPVCIHTPLLHGLDGDAKMSSSKGNYIAVDDSVEVITKKIKKSFCPQGEIEGNPMIEIAETFVFDAFGTSHRKHASTYGVSKKLPSCMGYLVKKETETFDQILDMIK